MPQMMPILWEFVFFMVSLVYFLVLCCWVQFFLFKSSFSKTFGSLKRKNWL